MDSGREAGNLVAVSRLARSHKSEKRDDRVEEIALGENPQRTRAKWRKGRLEIGTSLGKALS
jgi:hypothetical protein